MSTESEEECESCGKDLGVEAFEITDGLVCGACYDDHYATDADETDHCASETLSPKELRQNKEITISTDVQVNLINGEIKSQNIEHVIKNLLIYGEVADSIEQPELSKDLLGPFSLYINSEGGAASQGFALYDIICMNREKFNIKTYGIGQVMSAAVILLAAGTKGERRISRNCRVMIHGAASSVHGYVSTMGEELEEIKQIETMYVNTLSRETNMSRRKIRRIIAKKENYYISAKKAIKLGIADIIV